MQTIALRPLRVRPEVGVSLRGAMLVWLAMLVSFAQFRFRPAAELFGRGGMDFQVKLQIAIWLGLGLLAGYLILTGRVQLGWLRQAPLCWYAAYCLWALMSALWSPSPSLSGFRAGQLAVALVLVLSLGGRLKDVYTFILVFLGVNWVLVILGITGLNFGQSWILPPGQAYLMLGESPGVPWRFCSAFGHPTPIGALAAAAAVGLLARTRAGDWKKNGPRIAFLALTAVLTVSRTGIAGMVLGALLVLVIRREMWPVVLGTAVILLPLALLPTFDEGVVGFLRRGQSSSELKSFTGRDEIYAAELKRAERAGFIGLGFQCSRIASKDISVEEVHVAHAHNAFLESYTSLGVPGLTLAIVLVLSLSRAIVRLIRRCSQGACADNLAGWELTGMAVPMFAYCLTDSGFAVNPNQYVMLFMLLTVRLTTLVAESPQTSYQLQGVLRPSPPPTGTPAGVLDPSR